MHLTDRDVYAESNSTSGSGVRDVLGQSLPATETTTLHTVNQPYQFHAALHTNWQRYRVLQTDIWRFQADAGPLSVQLFSDWQPAIVRVVVTLALPHAGRYSLHIYDNRVAEVAVSGTEMQFPAVTPAISLSAMAAFNVKNAAFAVAPVVQNPTATAQVGIYQNRVTLSEGAPAADGSSPPVMADTSKLPDGVFSLTVTGTAPGSGNQGEAVNGQRYFYPGRTISRAEAATMLGRALGLIMGWINGFPDGSYQPMGQLQRDEAAPSSWCAENAKRAPGKTGGPLSR